MGSHTYLGAQIFAWLTDRQEIYKNCFIEEVMFERVLEEEHKALLMSSIVLLANNQIILIFFSEELHLA